MKKRLNENVLVPSDIALTTANELISKLVRKATSSETSHAMLYVTHCSVIHADGKGVWANNTQSLLFDLEMPVFVLRLKSGPTADAARRICDHARNIVGTEYSKTEAARAARAKDFRAFSSKQFCSRLIAQAYAAEGYQLVRDPNFCTPQELLDRPLRRHHRPFGVPAFSERTSSHPFWRQISNRPSSTLRRPESKMPARHPSPRHALRSQRDLPPVIFRAKRPSSFSCQMGASALARISRANPLSMREDATFAAAAAWYAIDLLSVAWQCE
jgi:Permuted papain-like amidase enzyme, YaeF/YiiX, C92 family